MELQMVKNNRRGDILPVCVLAVKLFSIDSYFRLHIWNCSLVPLYSATFSECRILILYPWIEKTVSRALLPHPISYCHSYEATSSRTYSNYCLSGFRDLLFSALLAPSSFPSADIMPLTTSYHFKFCFHLFSSPRKDPNFIT